MSTLQKIITYTLLTLSSTFFSGCSTKDIKSQKSLNSKVPNWIKHSNSLAPSFAVGAANKNFQGTYIQYQNAMNNAKASLSHSIKTTIISHLKNNIQTNNGQLTSSTYSKIDDLSNAFLENSYQIDGYIDKNEKLYILLYSPELNDMKEKKPLKLSKPHAVAYKSQSLFQSKCYTQEVRKSIKTKALIRQGKPEWFFRPNEDGKIGSIGIAEKIPSQTFQTQKKYAILLAKGSYSKRIRSKVQSKYNLMDIVKENTSGHLLETSATIQSANHIKKITLKDIWMDPRSCELFVYIVKSKLTP